MPAQSPVTHQIVSAWLNAIGACIRTRRKGLGVSVNAAAQAACMSRVTLHRIEHGEPSVTMGAYLNAMNVLGLDIDLVARLPQYGSSAQIPEPQEAGGKCPDAVLPPVLRLADYPQLQQLAWHLPGTSELTPAEAFGVYERHWRHLEPQQLNAKEQALLTLLVSTFGKGHLLV